MPTVLVRFQKAGCFHFITFSCYQRLPLLAREGGYGLFEQELEELRRRYRFVVAGYVLMPEHVHLLVSEPGVSSLATVLQVLKQETSKLLKLSREVQFWQRRYYDFNVHGKTTEKLRYMHRNPVKRGLVTRPEEWAWVQLPSLRNGRTGKRRDRVALDRTAAGTGRNIDISQLTVGAPCVRFFLSRAFPPLTKTGSRMGHPADAL